MRHSQQPPPAALGALSSSPQGQEEASLVCFMASPTPKKMGMLMSLSDLLPGGGGGATGRTELLAAISDSGRRT